jgi:hypothetical protein
MLIPLCPVKNLVYSYSATPSEVIPFVLRVLASVSKAIPHLNLVSTRINLSPE